MGHHWDTDGERCLKCGDKDWFAGAECAADKPKTTYTHLVIERKTSGPEWEPFAYPKNDLEEAKKALSYLRGEEEKKRYKRPLRLVRETREYIDA